MSEDIRITEIEFVSCPEWTEIITLSECVKCKHHEGISSALGYVHCKYKKAEGER